MLEAGIGPAQLSTALALNPTTVSAWLGGHSSGGNRAGYLGRLTIVDRHGENTAGAVQGGIRRGVGHCRGTLIEGDPAGRAAAAASSGSAQDVGHGDRSRTVVADVARISAAYHGAVLALIVAQGDSTAHRANRSRLPSTSK